METAHRFGHDRYTVRRKVLKLVGGAFHIYDPEGNVVLYSALKAFRLKEDIRLYASESMDEELVTIQARNVIDFGATYDVVDAQTGEAIGSLRRKGMKSMIRDQWHLLDAEGNEIGTIREESGTKAVLRRIHGVFAMIMPQGYFIESGGQTLATFQQNFNPFVQKIEVDFSPDEDHRLDRQFGLAAAVLLCAIEGRQRG